MRSLPIIATILLAPATLTVAFQTVRHTVTPSPPPRRVVLDHDAANTAAWSTSTALRMSPADLLDQAFTTQPYLSAFMMCAIKAASADWTAQTQYYQQQQKQPQEQEVPATSDSTEQSPQQFQLDLMRNLAFLAYGGLWQGMGQHFMYSELYPILFGSAHTAESVLRQVAFETTIMGPCVCMPIVYSMKSVITSGDVSLERVGKALASYVDDVATQGLLTKYWSIWIPAYSIAFGVIPPHLRVFFVAAVSFFWTTILSSVSSSSSSSSLSPAIPPVTSPAFVTTTDQVAHSNNGPVFGRRRPAYVTVVPAGAMNTKGP